MISAHDVDTPTIIYDCYCTPLCFPSMGERNWVSDDISDFFSNYSVTVLSLDGMDDKLSSILTKLIKHMNVLLTAW